MNGPYATLPNVMAALVEIESTSDDMFKLYQLIIHAENCISEIYEGVDEDLRADVFAAFQRKIMEANLPYITREARRTWS